MLSRILFQRVHKLRKITFLYEAYVAHAAVKLLINTCNFGKKEIIDEIFKVYVVFLKFFDSIEIFFYFVELRNKIKLQP